jgi:hypothetical protein
MIWRQISETSRQNLIGKDADNEDLWNVGNIAHISKLNVEIVMISRVLSLGM